MNRSAIPEVLLFESGNHGMAFLVPVRCFLKLRRWCVPDSSEKPPVVEPVHPFQGREFHILKATPRAPSFYDFRLVQADDRFS
jgi:hypothetical protein